MFIVVGLLLYYILYLKLLYKIIFSPPHHQTTKSSKMAVKENASGDCLKLLKI